MTFSREDTRDKITFRLSDELRERLATHLDGSDMNQSEAIRTALDDYLSDPDPRPELDLTPPAEPELAEAWEILNNLAGKPGKVDKGTALPYLAQETGVMKDVAERRLIKPLEQRGYLRVIQQMERVEYHLRRRFEQ